MSETTPVPRPEPVLDAQQLTRLTLGLLGAVSALLAFFGITLNIDDTVTQAIGSLVGLGILVAGVVLPRLGARRARELVTPVADPRAADGTRLVRERRAVILPAPADTLDPPTD